MSKAFPPEPSEAEIERYYRTAPVGAAAVVKQTQGGILLFHLAEIELRKPELGRVYIRGHGAFYMKHGKNCFHPKGQTTLVPPDEATLAWARAHPMGELMWGAER